MSFVVEHSNEFSVELLDSYIGVDYHCLLGFGLWLLLLRFSVRSERRAKHKSDKFILRIGQFAIRCHLFENEFVTIFSMKQKLIVVLKECRCFLKSFRFFFDIVYGLNVTSLEVHVSDVKECSAVNYWSAFNSGPHEVSVHVLPLSCNFLNLTQILVP